MIRSRSSDCLSSCNGAWTFQISSARLLGVVLLLRMLHSHVGSPWRDLMMMTAVIVVVGIIASVAIQIVLAGCVTFPVAEVLLSAHQRQSRRARVSVRSLRRCSVVLSHSCDNPRDDIVQQSNIFNFGRSQVKWEADLSELAA